MANPEPENGGPSRIELRAIITRDGSVLLIRAGEGERWELPGGPFAEELDDVDSAMDTLLRGYGIVSANLAEDFLHTEYLPAGDGQFTVLNLYAPQDWMGDPVAPEGAALGWYAPESLQFLDMDPHVRNGILPLFGVDADRHEFTTADLPALTPRPPVPEGPWSAPGDGAPGDLPASPYDRRVAGMDVLRTILGDDPAVSARSLESQYPELTRHIIDFALGEVWSSPTLDRKTRSLQVVAMLAAMGGKAGPLRSHVGGALNHGATADEIVETMRMVAVYAGFPAAMEAWPVMEEVFAARGIRRPGHAR